MGLTKTFLLALAVVLALDLEALVECTPPEALRLVFAEELVG